MNGNNINNSRENTVPKNRYYLAYLIGFSLILILPIISIPPWFHPASWGKAVVFRIIFVVLIFLFLKQIISREIKISQLKEKIKGISLIFWLLLSLTGIYLLSTAISQEPYFSFWGSPYRAGGSLNLVLYIFFAFLVFFIVRPKDWKKLWNIAFIGALIVSFIALFQKLEMFSRFLVPYQERTVSTMGASNLLGVYLTLFVLTALSFGLKSYSRQISTPGMKKKNKKYLFYFLCSLFFFFALVLSGTRAAFFGIFFGFLFFIFFYPQAKSKYRKKIVAAKIIIGAGLILSILGLYWISWQPEIFKKIEKNRVFGNAFYRIVPARFSFLDLLGDSRFSAWKISFQALKEKPILGFGPENFSIAFDKYYDPAVENIAWRWWDRAHNFIFDISVTSGVPALIIYLTVLFLLMKGLRKVKKKDPPKTLVCHGIQATFISYLVANFFTFDCSSTYIISFFLIAYSLSLIRESSGFEKNLIKNKKEEPQAIWKTGSVFALFCLMIAFAWYGALKPLKINKEINWAVFYSEKRQCQQAINKFEEILSSESIVDNYLRLQYINTIGLCKEKYPDQKAKLAQKAVQLLDEAKVSRPTYTRTWIFLGTYINIFVENSNDLDPKIKEDLLAKGETYFQKALELSPRRLEAYNGLLKTLMLSKKYQEMEKKADICISMEPNWPHCWWAKCLALTAMGELDEVPKYLEITTQKGYDYFNTKKAFLELLYIYIDSPETKKHPDYYKNLADVYKRLIDFDRNNFQYRASLAYLYKELGKYQEAAREAVWVFVLSPESIGPVEEFLNTLPTDKNFYWAMTQIYQELIKTNPKNFQYHASLAFVYKQLGEYDKAKKEAVIVLELSPDLKAFVESFLKTMP